VPELGLTDFILAHNDTIEELDMGYSLRIDIAASFGSASLTRLRADSLPRLHSFRGNTLTLGVMAKARMSCLTTSLRRLVIGRRCVWSPAYELQPMFDALLSDGATPLSSLKEFEIEFWHWERDRVQKDIRNFAKCCGASLEVWRGTLPYVKMNAQELGELFGLFEKLRVIHISARTIFGTDEGDDDTVVAYVCSLASVCQKLQEACVIYQLPRKDELWMIMRALDPGGGSICSVRRVG